MNFTQLITEVQKVALKQHNVNSFSSNDVYDEWNKPHTQYASVNIGLESADRTENTIIYNCVLYYGDRLLQNASNKIAIQDDAVKVLQGIISNLPDEITYYTPINYTIFEQEFADYIAGAYCRVRLETEFDQGNCSLDDYIEELKILYITENGIFSVAGYDQVKVNVLEGITEEECREIVEGYNYATKDEIPSLEGYATEDWVNEQGFIKSGEIPELTGYAKIVDVDASLAKKQDNILDLDIIRSGAALGATAIQEHQSLAGYATESWVNEQGFLTEHQSLADYLKIADAANTYATKSEIAGLGLKMKIVDELPEVGDPKTIYLLGKEDELETDNWYDEYVFIEGDPDNHWEKIGDTKVDLTDYAKKSDIPSLSGYATTTYVNTELAKKQPVGDYALKSEIPSVEGLATTIYVNTELAKKQDTISDLTTIRSGAALGATAIQEHQSLKTINNQSIVGTGNITIQSGGSVVSLTQAEYDALEDKDPDTLYNITDGSPVATEEWVRSIFQYDEDTKTLNIII